MTIRGSPARASVRFLKTSDTISDSATAASYAQASGASDLAPAP